MRKATLPIPVHEVEARGEAYGYVLISRRTAVPPPPVQSRMRLAADARLIHVRALHLASGAAYAHEDRWMNPETVPGLDAVDFGRISANEWLVQSAPYTSGELTFHAAAASADVAGVLGCPERAAVLAMERVTWLAERSITQVRLTYRPGHIVHTTL